MRSKSRLNIGDIVVVENAWNQQWEGAVAVVSQYIEDTPWFELLYPQAVNWDSQFHLGAQWPKYMRVLGNVNG